MIHTTTTFLLESTAAADRRGSLAGALRPFAVRPNVFVADDDAATRVTIHKTPSLDIEVAIATATAEWTATVRDAATGAPLACGTRAYRHTAAEPHARRAALLRDVHAFLFAVVDAPVRLADDHQPKLETTAGERWRQVVPFLA
ncbi:MAG: hypothetical protein JNK15_18180 [Planctomycetes bacterium]|nr:hypothetical protein [Planctomycetota bacterium]